MKEAHENFMCDLCITNRPLFPMEHKRFLDKAAIASHIKKGENGNSAFKGHPVCTFCNRRHFFDKEQLLKHLNQAHQNCHICKRKNGGKAQFFKDYPSLKEHFNQEHFSCPHPDCIAARLVVFGSTLELNQHIINTHPEIATKEHRVVDSSVMFSLTPRDARYDEQRRASSQRNKKPTNNRVASSSSTPSQHFSMHTSAFPALSGGGASSSTYTSSSSTRSGSTNQMSRFFVEPSNNRGTSSLSAFPSLPTKSKKAQQRHRKGAQKANNMLSIDRSSKSSQNGRKKKDGGGAAKRDESQSTKTESRSNKLTQMRTVVQIALNHNDQLYKKFQELSADLTDQKLDTASYYTALVELFPDMDIVFNHILQSLSSSTQQAELRLIHNQRSQSSFRQAGSMREVCCSNPTHTRMLFNLTHTLVQTPHS